MDHDTTLEQLELAALEPDGLERLMAGDTASAQAVAAHLAGCPSCTAELVRLERAAPIIRDSVRELMPADLRERTLAAVRAEGRPRGASLTPALAGAGAGTSGAAAPVIADPEAAAYTAPTPMRATTGSTTRRQVLGWIGAIAAAVVLSVVTTSIIVGSRVDDQLASQAETISALEEVTTQTLAVTSEPDAQHVALAGTTDPALAGSLAFSPTTAELVVVADGLTEPAAGHEYRCWVENRRRPSAHREDVLQCGPGLLGRPGTRGRRAVRCGAVRGEPGRDRRHKRRWSAGPGRWPLGARRAGDLLEVPLLIAGLVVLLGPSDLGPGHFDHRFLVVLDERLTPDPVRWGSVQIRPVEQEQSIGRLGADVVAVLGQDGGQPGGLARSLDRVDLDVAPSGIHDDEPDQTGSHHQPDDEQPAVELGIHRGEV